MKLKMLLIVLLVLMGKSFAQTKIETKDGIHYITTDIGYAVTGTYFFNGAEPTVELNANGTGLYQLHEQPKKAVTWGFECNEAGEPLFNKGFDNAAYTLWYLYTSPENEDEGHWKAVPFTIHFNSLKMYIQGERCKNYTE